MIVISMDILTEIQSTLDGKEDRAGITAFDVYISVSGSEKKKAQKISEVHCFLDSNKVNDSSYWYFIQMAISRWGLSSTDLSSKIVLLLDSPECISNYQARFYALRSLVSLDGQLLPKEIDKERSLKSGAPGLWLDLMLEAYAGGNADYITSEIRGLVRGTSPKLSWKELRSKLPEIRKAYDNIPTFRSKMKIVASDIRDPSARQNLLKAVDRRVGGRLAQQEISFRDESGPLQYSFPQRLFDRERETAQKIITPTGELVEAAL